MTPDPKGNKIALAKEDLLNACNLVVVSLLVLSTPLTHSQTSEQMPSEGRITGTVLDELGQPINEARVCSALTSAPKPISECYVKTDSTGQFQIDHLPMGTIEVSASKGEDGYQDFYPPAHIQRVILTPQDPLATVISRLGPKAGILIPSVTDKVTGKVLRDFWVQWKVLDGSMAGTTGFSSVSTRASVPAGRDLSLSMSAKGYGRWV
ncbi:MAG: carboxypeptidase-like regulatory domain-containing protein [Candidatus Sulfotelmatobacter sp.]